MSREQSKGRVDDHHLTEGCRGGGRRGRAISGKMMEDVKGDEEGDCCISAAVAVACYGAGEDFVCCLDWYSRVFILLLKLP